MSFIGCETELVIVAGLEGPIESNADRLRADASKPHGVCAGAEGEIGPPFRRIALEIAVLHTQTHVLGQGKAHTSKSLPRKYRVFVAALECDVVYGNAAAIENGRGAANPRADIWAHPHVVWEMKPRIRHKGNID